MKSQRKPRSDFSVTHRSIAADSTSVGCFGMHMGFWIGIAKQKKKSLLGLVFCCYLNAAQVLECFSSLHNQISKIAQNPTKQRD